MSTLRHYIISFRRDNSPITTVKASSMKSDGQVLLFTLEEEGSKRVVAVVSHEAIQFVVEKESQP